ncbi:hypothetical protein CAEBREN_29005 [Caenorhabditis brenneri]|uniref:Uncharacterized protein n=1 Tax=Caenorhabditis brenneri TaxID=135651 RepID=G0NP98_CAEBE|nr:hypothetical protein CAEBREN_29005 [Caenorhabditis brenneri]
MTSTTMLTTLDLVTPTSEYSHDYTQIKALHEPNPESQFSLSMG